ncbi:MAG: glycosyltransferase [Bacteroidota bacterium]
MKVLVVGSDKIFAIENCYVKYLKELGVEVNQFSAQSIFYDYYQKNILNKLIFKAGLSSVYIKINQLFKQAVENFQPDVIWVFKGMEIFPESLQWASNKKIKLVNYNPDNPFLFSGKGSGNQNVTKSIPLYDMHFTYNLAIKKKMEDDYYLATAFLPFGFDISEALYDECSKQEEVIKACFLGNPDKKRAFFVEALAAEGIEMDIYGNDWSKFVHHPKINIFPPVYGNELWKVLRRYRLQLNLMRIHNEDSHNMRTFEVPGIGGILVAPNTPEHRFFFVDRKEVFLYEDVKHCTKLMQELLSLSPTKALQIRQQARQRSENSGYSYKERAEHALKQMVLLHA